MTDSKRSKSSKNPSAETASPKGAATSSSSGSIPGDDPLAGLSDLPPLEVGLKQASGEASPSGETSRQDFMIQPPIDQVDDFEDLGSYQKKWELQQKQNPGSTPAPATTPVLDLSVRPLPEEAPPPTDLEMNHAVSMEIDYSNDTTSSDPGTVDISPAQDFGSATSINASQFEAELPEFAPLDASEPTLGNPQVDSLSEASSEGEILPPSDPPLDLPPFPEEPSPTDSGQSTFPAVGPESEAPAEKEHLVDSAEAPSFALEASQDFPDPSTLAENSSHALPPSSDSADSAPTLHSQLAGTSEQTPSPIPAAPTPFRSAPVPEKVPAGHPDLYTLVIEGNLSPEEREKLTDLVLRNDLGIKEADLAIQFRSQQIFLPKLTEFTAVVIAQAMRAVGGRLRVFHASRLEDSSRQTEGVLTGQANQDMNTKVTLAAPMDHPAEQIPITQDQWIPDLPPEQVESIRVLSATAILNPEEVADAASAVYQARLESLCRELRFRAHFLGIHALVSFHSQLTPLSLSPHYRLTVSVNGLTRKSTKTEPTEETTKRDERNLSG